MNIQGIFLEIMVLKYNRPRTESIGANLREKREAGGKAGTEARRPCGVSAGGISSPPWAAATSVHCHC